MCAHHEPETTAQARHYHWSDYWGPNKVRALLSGLVALSRHTADSVRVIVQLASVWEAWHHAKHRLPYMDILAEVPPQDFQRVTVLYISKNTRTPPQAARLCLSSLGEG